MRARSTRYDIQRPLEYLLRDASGPVLGAGRTLNISRRGLLFQTEDEVKVGSKIELDVRIGSALDDDTQVNLHVQGITVRSEEGKVAVAIKKYRLRPITDHPARSTG